MTISSLELKDGIAEFMPSHNELCDPSQEKLEEIQTSEFPEHRLREIFNRFEQHDNRIDKLELAAKNLNLNEATGSLEYKSLREYVRNSATLEHKGTGGEALSYLVPREISMHMDKQISKRSVMRKLCSVEKVSSDNLEYFVTDNKDTFAGWGGESGAIRDDTQMPKVHKITIYLYELYSQPQIAKKVLDDSLIDIEGWLVDNLIDAFSRKENEAFIVGDGQNKPKGILSYKDGKGIGEIERIKVKKLDGDSIIKLYYSLDEYFSSRAAFIMHRSVLQEIRSLKTSAGQYLLQPGKSGEETLLGMPVYQTSDMPLFNNAILPVIAFADFKNAYKIVENHDIRILRDPYTSKSFIKFYTTKRIGGNLVNGHAIKLLSVSSI